MTVPVTMLLDLIAVEQIKMEGFDYVPSIKEGQMMLRELFSRG